MGSCSGVELSWRFYREVVAPLLRTQVGGVPHSAALLGSGSEVLGFDTERSTDHDWGPRLQLFLRPGDGRTDAVHDVLAGHLPASFLGHRTWFPRTHETGRRHGVDVTTLDDWLTDRLGVDPRRGMTTADWLATPTQLLASVTAGAVHHDGLSDDEWGGLGRARRQLAWYPDDVWRHVLACQWQRISEEEPWVGRCGEVGDELGSAVVAGRLVRDVMRLCLLMARRYPPYGKWLGSAFARVPGAGELAPMLGSTLTATAWTVRESRLAVVLEEVAARHNALGLTATLDPRTRSLGCR